MASCCSHGLTRQRRHDPLENHSDWPANGPAIAAVIGAFSTKTPDQNQSSAAASVPPFGSRSSPTCQSAELVEVDALTPVTTAVNGSEPLLAHSPTVLASKSIPYAKLYQLPASSCVDHFVVPSTHQRRVLSSLAESPLSRPYFSSVKWFCMRYVKCDATKTVESWAYLEEGDLMLELWIRGVGSVGHQ